MISLGINSTTEPFATTRWGSGEIKGAGAHNHQQRDWSLTAGGIGEMNNYQFTCSCDCHLYWLLLREMQNVIQFSESEQLGQTSYCWGESVLQGPSSVPFMIGVSILEKSFTKICCSWVQNVAKHFQHWLKNLNSSKCFKCIMTNQKELIYFEFSPLIVYFWNWKCFLTAKVSCFYL